MTERTKVPHKEQDPQEVKELLQSLEAHTKKGKGKGGFSVKKTTFVLPSGRSVDSWRLQDWDYKKPFLPTYSRGLFTYKTLEGVPEIAVRGYDKFFNHGEVRKTEWTNVQKNTRGPYELSVKENGCIIFISGLDDETLLVCSKHSTGPREDVSQSHASTGEKWIDRQLESLGKTRRDLARQLRQMNATAVAELCDDTFEEHVLAYNPESAGLYLHGINLNLPEFMTYPGHLVDRFATDWGFKKTMYVMEEDVLQVKKFLDEVAETGSYAGRETEGFVIRCQARDSENEPWHDWFFKYKFEEPYLMYRQWRECTKAVIAGRPPKYKKHKKITEEYLTFARRHFAQNPALAKQYNLNHGIIALRDAFLNERGLKGSDIIRQEIEGGEVGSMAVTKNVVLVPVATIGCGKTTVALALVKLFGWGHVQNDNIEGRQRRPQRFAFEICSNLAAHPVVIADRNNHQKRERQQVIEDVQKALPDARFVALHYVHDPTDYDQIRKATRERVINRGDNHQTIQAGSKNQGEIIDIMEGFLYRFQPVDPNDAPDDAFDLVINLDVTATSRENLETVVAQLHAEYPKLFGDMPTADDLDEAVDGAMKDYTPLIKHDLSRDKNASKKSKSGKHNHQKHDADDGSVDAAKPRQVEYFAVKVPSRVNAILEAIFRDKSPDHARFYRQLLNSRRIQAEFHVTLIHRASSAANPQEWKSLTDLHTFVSDKAGENQKGDELELGTCKVQLERLVWDARLMCFVVRLIDSGTGEPSDGEANEFKTVNPVAHITVGTASKDIKPKESNELLQRWLQGGSGEETGISEEPVKGHVVLDGSVRAVLQRR